MRCVFGHGIFAFPSEEVRPKRPGEWKVRAGLEPLGRSKRGHAAIHPLHEGRGKPIRPANGLDSIRPRKPRKEVEIRPRVF